MRATPLFFAASATAAATASFTLDVYGHVSEKMKKESAARMEAFIESVKKA